VKVSAKKTSTRGDLLMKECLTWTHMRNFRNQQRGSEGPGGLCPAFLGKNKCQCLGISEDRLLRLVMEACRFWSCLLAMGGFYHVWFELSYSVDLRTTNNHSTGSIRESRPQVLEGKQPQAVVMERERD
jgi:hypothetical protein